MIGPSPIGVLVPNHVVPVLKHEPSSAKTVQLERLVMQIFVPLHNQSLHKVVTPKHVQTMLGLPQVGPLAHKIVARVPCFEMSSVWILLLALLWPTLSVLTPSLLPRKSATPPCVPIITIGLLNGRSVLRLVVVVSRPEFPIVMI